jgi:hypothetical protein
MRPEPRIKTPKSTAYGRKKEDIYAYADAVPVLLTFALRWEKGGGAFPNMQPREKREIQVGKHNEMFCSTVRTS